MSNFDSDKFRKVLGHFPTGVTVITGAQHGTDTSGAKGDKQQSTPFGLSVGSFASVSLDPPLVMFCAGKNSQSWPDIEATGHFCVNVLSHSQSEVSNIFAAKDIDKFENIKWETKVTGSPVLDGALCWIDCKIQTIHEAGDHWIVIGEVQDLGLGETAVEESEMGPLVFFKGGYYKIQELEA